MARALGLTDPTGEILQTFGQALPAEVARVIGDELRTVVQRDDAGLLSVGAAAALWTATGGTNALLKGVGRAYGIQDTRPFWQRYALGLGLTVAGGWLVVTLFVVFLGVQLLGADLAARVGVEPLWRALLYIRWVLAIPVLIVVSATLYRFGTPERPHWRPVLIGAALGSVAWLVVTFGFALYVDRIGGYGATYGALAGVAGLLAWLYFSGFVFLIGAEITAFLHEASVSPPPDGVDPATRPVAG